VDGPDSHSAMTATTHVWYMLCVVMLPCWWITPCNITCLDQWSNISEVTNYQYHWSIILVFSVVWNKVPHGSS